MADPDNFMSNLFRDFDRDLTVQLAAESEKWEAPRLLKMWMEDSSNALMSIPGSENAQANPIILQSRKAIVMDYSFEADSTVTTFGRIVAEISGPNAPRLEIAENGKRSKIT